MHVALYLGPKGKGNVDATCIDLTWAELAAQLTQVEQTDCHPCAGKDCPAKSRTAWSPARLSEPYRCNANVLEVTALVGDCDHLTAAQMQLVAEKLQPYNYIAYTTHNHQGGDDNSFRVVLEIEQPVPAAQWRGFLAAAVEDLGVPFDPTCKDLSRVYYFATIPAGRDSFSTTNAGAPYRLPEGAEVLPDAPETAPDAPGAPGSPPEVHADLATLRKVLAARCATLKRAGDERHDLVARVLEGRPLAQVGNRDNTILSVAGIMAFALPVQASADAMLEILRPSLTAMEAPEGVDHWILVARAKLGAAILREAAWSAKRKLESDEAKAKAISDLFGKPEETNEGAAPDWLGKLIWNTKGDGGLKACSTNIRVILTQSRDAGQFRLNEVTKTIEIVGGKFEGLPVSALGVRVATWLESFKLQVPISLVEAHILDIAVENSYNPIAEYLESLTWDGVPRVDTVFPAYFGAEDSDHVRRVGAVLFISLVARGLIPGCQVDTTIILEGAQGTRKTSAVRLLAGPWYSSMSSRVGDKDSRQMLTQSWILEFGELIALRNSDADTLKHFISEVHDKFRLPFARSIEIFLRTCVFIGTTNDEAYLTDITGNRRFLPIRCGQIDTDALQRDKDQIFAEAVTRFKNGEPWHLRPAEQQIADEINELRLVSSPIETKIPGWWFAKKPEARPPYITSHEVAEQAMLIPAERITRAVETRVGFVMKKLGFVKELRTLPEFGNKRVYVFIPNDHLLTYAYNKEKAS